METKADPRTTEATAGRTVNAENRPKNSLDFELSDGREFIRLSNLPPGLTVLNFWRADCPPCVREMPLLAEFAREGKARVITVALQRPAETLAAPPVVVAALNQPVIALYGPSEPRGLLARFGKAALPKPGGDKIGRRRLDTHGQQFALRLWRQRRIKTERAVRREHEPRRLPREPAR